MGGVLSPMVLLKRGDEKEGEETALKRTEGKR